MSDQIRAIGRLKYQIDWDSSGWWYTNNENEKINMNFFAGTVEFEGTRLYQFIVGPLMISWGWTD
jgi:hypothetical protein